MKEENVKKLKELLTKIVDNQRMIRESLERHMHGNKGQFILEEHFLEDNTDNRDVFTCIYPGDLNHCFKDMYNESKEGINEESLVGEIMNKFMEDPELLKSIGKGVLKSEGKTNQTN